MSDEPDALQAEVERLRAEVESYRQRELADLHAALAAARQEAAAWKVEANRISQVGQQVAAGYQEEIARLRGQIEVKEQVARQVRRATSANTSRN